MTDFHIFYEPESLVRRHEGEYLEDNVVNNLPGPDVPSSEGRDHGCGKGDAADCHDDTSRHDEYHVQNDGQNEAVPREFSVVDIEEGNADAGYAEEDTGVPPHGNLLVLAH